MGSRSESPIPGVPLADFRPGVRCIVAAILCYALVPCLLPSFHEHVYARLMYLGTVGCLYTFGLTRLMGHEDLFRVPFYICHLSFMVALPTFTLHLSLPFHSVVHGICCGIYLTLEIMVCNVVIHLWKSWRDHEG